MRIVLAAAVLVVGGNAFVLLHAMLNRSSGDVHEILLTERELPVAWRGRDNSGISLMYAYHDSTLRERPAASRRELAYVALEYEGPAWQQWRESQVSRESKPWIARASRLVLVDIGGDAAVLREKYRGRKDVLILRAIVRGSRIDRVLPDRIHVPRPFGPMLNNFDPRPPDLDPRYRVKLRVGRFYEPWVAGVELMDSNSSPSRP